MKRPLAITLSDEVANGIRDLRANTGLTLRGFARSAHQLEPSYTPESFRVLWNHCERGKPTSERVARAGLTVLHDSAFDLDDNHGLAVVDQAFCEVDSAAAAERYRRVGARLDRKLNELAMHYAVADIQAAASRLSEDVAT